MSNFHFLGIHHPKAREAANQAEKLLWIDPSACLVKLRSVCELLTSNIASRLGFYSTNDKFDEVIKKLDSEGALTYDLRQMLYGVKKAGNDAAHENYGTISTAKIQLRAAWHVAVWFHRTVEKNPNFNPSPFVDPQDPSQAVKDAALKIKALNDELSKVKSEAANAKAESAAVKEHANTIQAKLKESLDQIEALGQERAEWEQLAAANDVKLQELTAELAAKSASVTVEQIQETLSVAHEAAAHLDLNEAETRRIIDARLIEAGWDADSVELTYAKGARPTKSKYMAIAEWPTEAGKADYVLFDGLTAVAIIEAKRKHTDVPGALEQARRYSKNFLPSSEVSLVPGGPWRQQQVPFLFATNGREYIRQLREKSGIHFHDVRRANNLPRVLAGFYTPEGLRNLLSVDIDLANTKLKEEPTDYLQLRDYQLRAIKAIEGAIAANQTDLLIAMATGTGKTKTCIGLVYRLIKSKRFRRILFLVDREVLGRQTYDAFAERRMEDDKLFTKIYGVKQLHEMEPDSDTRVQIATVQGMIQRIMYASAYGVPPVDRYDCIIIDECHRGYALDREMSDVELSFRNEFDYFSKYRRVIEHFDAVRIGLTATPALHTSDIFGRPVFSYTYREAVIDGWLIDHDVPYTIRTKLLEEGTKIPIPKVGEKVLGYNPYTQAVEELDTLPDELNFEIDDFHHKVIVEDYNRVVCQVIAEQIPPSSKGKTLIFCVNVHHADMVVRLLSEALKNLYTDFTSDMVIRITGNSDKPLELVKRFRNEGTPKYVVTVDLLTTGVDIPAICNLVFLRRVRSRILYEQMLGRATRPCPDIEKERFMIYDAVALYSALERVTAMRPVVVNPTFSFAHLTKELTELLDGEARKLVYEEWLAKLQRRRHSLPEDMQDVVRHQADGMDMKELGKFLRGLTPQAMADWLAGHKALVRTLDESRNPISPVPISNDKDELLDRGQKFDDQLPADYLAEFAAFIDKQRNLIPALNIVLQRPRELTRESLKEVRSALDNAGYSETKIRTAWKLSKNEDIAASIIGFIRQQALGEPLVPYKQRVANALQKILASRAWDAEQVKWLERIAKQMELEVVVDRAALDRGAFQNFGGAKRADKVFAGHTEDVLGDLLEALWKAG